MKKSNEKILGALFLALLFGIANFEGYSWISQGQSKLDLRYAELHADKADAQFALTKEDLWAERQAWIAQHEPVMTEEDSTKAQVLETVLKGARDQNLEVLDQNLGDAQHSPGGTCVNISLKIKGPIKGLCQWLVDLQKPENFYAVPEFSLKADDDEKSMVCTLRIGRYFRPGP